MEAIRNAVHDSGLGWDDTSWGMMAYGSTDRAFSDQIAQALGIQLDYHVDIFGGGNSTETMIGAAIGALEGGLADAMILYRTMNGYTEARIGGTPVGGTPVGEAPPPMFPTSHGGSMPHAGIYGVGSALQMFGLSFVRHMWEYGTTLEQLAHVKVAHSKGASNNPKAYYKNRYTVDDVLNSRLIVWPFGLLHCCVETDNATAIVITDIERARSLPHTPAAILGTAGRTHKYGPEYHWTYGPINRHADVFGREILWPNAGVQPHEVDITGSYDAFTFTALLQLEAYGFCDFGGGGEYVSDGTIELGRRPPQQPLRRPPLRGLHPRHEHGRRERPPAARHGRRLLPQLGRRRAQPRLRRGPLPPGARPPDHRQPRLGHALAGLRPRDDQPGLAADAPKRRRPPGRDPGERTENGTMASYLGAGVFVPEHDQPHREYLEMQATGALHVQKCSDCGHLRYPVPTACPDCRSLDSPCA